MVARAFLDTLKQKVLLSDIVAPFVSLKQKGGDWWGCCPFHQEKSPSFKVNNLRGTFYCFGCHEQGDGVSFLMDKQGLSFIEAVRTLCDKAGIALPQPDNAHSQTTQTNDVYAVLQDAADFYKETLHAPQGQEALNYLKGRGFSGQDVQTLCQTFSLGMTSGNSQGLSKALSKHPMTLKQDSGLFLPPKQNPSVLKDRFWDRLIFPLRDMKGRTIGFGGRTLSGSSVKYLNSPETDLFHKKEYLYGLFEARQNPNLRTQPWVLAEGYTDVMTLQHSGLAKAVAPLGTAVSTQQIERLFRLTPSVLVCFDGDVAGQKAALQLALKSLPLLTSALNLTFAILPKNEDPHSFWMQDRGVSLKKSLNHPLSLSQFLLKSLTQHFDLALPEQKAKAYASAREWCNALKDFDLKKSYQSFFYAALGHKSKTGMMAAPLATALSPDKKTMLQEKILLATCLNHPSLVQDHAEALAAPALSSVFETFRQNLLALDQVGQLETCHQSLAEKGFQSLLDQIESTPSLYQYAPFAHPKSSLEDAQKGLLDLLDLMDKNKQLLSHITQTERVLSSDMKEQDWSRLCALRDTWIKKSNNSE